MVMFSVFLYSSTVYATSILSKSINLVLIVSSNLFSCHHDGCSILLLQAGFLHRYNRLLMFVSNLMPSPRVHGKTCLQSVCQGEDSDGGYPCNPTFSNILPRLLLHQIRYRHIPTRKSSPREPRATIHLPKP